MSKKDHYAILGVKRTEDETGIKTAFRRLAKRYHPDLSGPEATRRFQEIVEAYEVLSDPESRASYNRTLGARDAAAAASRVKPGPSEPLETIDAVPSPRQWTSVSRGGPWGSPFEEYFHHTFSGGIADLADRVFGGRGAMRRRTLSAEIVLSREEAARGGVLPLRHPGLARCRFCGGVGLDERWQCRSCRAWGAEEGGGTFPVRIPPGVRDGTTLEFVIDGPDAGGVLLRIHLWVSGR